MTEKDKLLELIESIDPKSVEYVEFTPDDLLYIKN